MTRCGASRGRGKQRPYEDTHAQKTSMGHPQSRKAAEFAQSTNVCATQAFDQRERRGKERGPW